MRQQADRKHFSSAEEMENAYKKNDWPAPRSFKELPKEGVIAVGYIIDIGDEAVRDGYPSKDRLMPVAFEAFWSENAGGFYLRYSGGIVRPVDWDGWFDINDVMGFDGDPRPYLVARQEHMHPLEKPDFEYEYESRLANRESDVDRVMMELDRQGFDIVNVLPVMKSSLHNSFYVVGKRRFFMKKEAHQNNGCVPVAFTGGMSDIPENSVKADSFYFDKKPPSKNPHTQGSKEAKDWAEAHTAWIDQKTRNKPNCNTQWINQNLVDSELITMSCYKGSVEVEVHTEEDRQYSENEHVHVSFPNVYEFKAHILKYQQKQEG